MRLQQRADRASAASLSPRAARRGRSASASTWRRSRRTASSCSSQRRLPGPEHPVAREKVGERGDDADHDQERDRIGQRRVAQEEKEQALVQGEPAGGHQEVERDAAPMGDVAGLEGPVTLPQVADPERDKETENVRHERMGKPAGDQGHHDSEMRQGGGDADDPEPQDLHQSAPPLSALARSGSGLKSTTSATMKLGLCFTSSNTRPRYSPTMPREMSCTPANSMMLTTIVG